ncbi:DUF1398 family protein [Escherichia coli]|nr:DUF1398 family protein [Escherichia coli]
MTSLKTSIKTITYLSDIGCLEIQGASLENIHLVLENDNTVLIKGQGKVVNVRFSKNKCLIEATLKGFKSGELSFYEYRKNLATAGVFRWITNIHENKRYYYTFDNSLLFTENIQNTTQIFPH